MRLIPTLLVLACAALVAAPLSAQQPAANNLLSAVQLDKHVVSGKWRKVGQGLQVDPSRSARLMLPAKVTGSYSLTVEFTRLSGKDSLGVILPIGDRQCVFNLSVWGGEAHGIALIDGAIARDNSTTLRPGKLENEHPYRLLIEVEFDKNQASIGSQLDGRPFLKWKGRPSSLSLLDFWKLPRNDAIGLVSFSKVDFHRVALRPLDPSMRMTARPKASGASSSGSARPAASGGETTIRFEGKQWVTNNAESVAVKSFQGQPALHVKGREPSFVYLQSSEFASGEIEVDIASATFSGIGFRGTKRGREAEKVYFRPFNSGTSKHANTVQYSMLGREPFGWRALRERFPGKYESGANIKTNKWFHVRVKIDGRNLEVFVDDAKSPVLVVDKTLGDNDSGRLGVWGWDSYFRNFKFTPAK